MKFSEAQRRAIAKCLTQGIAFAAYRLPGKGNTVHFYCQPTADTEPKYGKFVINKFNTLSSNNIVINLCADAEEILATTDNILPLEENLDTSTTYSTCKELYIYNVSKLIERLKMTGGKTVISRIICGQTPNLLGKLSHVTENLWEKFPNAFGFLYYHPQTGCWLGATPELLLKRDAGSDEITTMALAGTQSDSQKDWSNKNIKEQRFVTEFLRESLANIGAEDIEEQTNTVRYGNIQHICTVLKAHIPEVDFDAILDAISPTPAVCGYPKEDALRDITEIEDFRRECYAGYIVLETQCESCAFVNIRSAKIRGNSWCIYVGGGITRDSDAEDEWAETTAKSDTLVQLLSHSNNE